MVLSVFLAHKTLLFFIWASRISLWEQIWIADMACEGYYSLFFLALYTRNTFCNCLTFWYFVTLLNDHPFMYRRWVGRFGADRMIVDSVLCHRGLPASMAFAQWRCVPRSDMFLALVFFDHIQEVLQLREIFGENKEKDISILYLNVALPSMCDSEPLGACKHDFMNKIQIPLSPNCV